MVRFWMAAAVALSVASSNAQTADDRLATIQNTLWDSVDYLAAGELDMTVFDHRQQFASALGDVDTPVPTAFLGLDEPVIIEARRAGEPDLAVPEDRVLFLPGETDIPLLLPPGRYRVQGFVKAGPVADAEMIDAPTR